VTPLIADATITLASVDGCYAVQEWADVSSECARTCQWRI